ncbi:TetR/AcrR family transcriptional regulator [Mycobacterium deserti]|uniref:TetR/AcrR family transcriptional regulator n=1 Tax=Mycobacterium deserti TaxID=2978347 RepID=A0ABT2M7Y9_9MYCO|nr:TetR/AcrR family transcriptional regulator [Mycobacterium deserti]MCT7657121.1 TetR/AcrR family transcriptional regulator [Mycobacterium deserti]
MRAGGTSIAVQTPHVGGDEDIDPRRLRSRARLLDAAARLLTTGGVEAVTIDAVTRASKVAKTTLYRHFDSATELLAATFERLLPQVEPPPATGPLRDQLVELLSRQAALLQDVPIQLTLLAWVSMGPTNDSAGEPRNTLRARVIEQYRQPFDVLLDSPQARAELGDFDLTLGLAQLLGPLVFAVMTGIHVIDRDDCARIVEDFYTTHQP